MYQAYTPHAPRWMSRSTQVMTAGRVLTAALVFAQTVSQWVDFRFFDLKLTVLDSDHRASAGIARPGDARLGVSAHGHAQHRAELAAWMLLATGMAASYGGRPAHGQRRGWPAACCSNPTGRRFSTGSTMDACALYASIAGQTQPSVTATTCLMQTRPRTCARARACGWGTFPGPEVSGD
jgi:hypothetical protein